MELSTPIWNSNTVSYLFRVLESPYSITQTLYYEPPNVDFPASPSSTEQFVREFLEKTKKYFTSPLTAEKVLRHIRHVADTVNRPKEAGWYEFTWKPYAFTIKAGEFTLSWQITGVTSTEPVIPANFTESTTPRAQTPKVPEQTTEQVRNIQIHDSLIPVGDLPLSDLPPLSFGTDEFDPAREETRRRIREARLKVQLAKLKAQRMEQKYYERYGQVPEDSEESSDFSSDSEEDQVSFGNRSHS